MAESFFATQKKELVCGEVDRTRSEARAAIFEYIEVFYNRRRLLSLLGYQTPDEFESCPSTRRVAEVLSTCPGNRINSTWIIGLGVALVGRT